MNPLQLTGFEQDRAALIAEIMPVFKMHARLANTDEDMVVERYIGAAVAAAENYLMRDVWPTTRTWTGDLCMNPAQPFVVRRGRARTLTLTDAQSAPIAPASYAVLASADPKTWGFQIAARADLTGITVVSETGWLTLADMPDDLQLFLQQAAAAFSEVRELANYGGGVQATAIASYIPTYLLDSWANLTYA
jgi:hypothetical protein